MTSECCGTKTIERGVVMKRDYPIYSRDTSGREGFGDQKTWRGRDAGNVSPWQPSIEIV